MPLEYPKKPIKFDHETEEDFAQRVEFYKKLLKKWKTQYRKMYREKNKENLKAKRKIYTLKNLEKIKAQTKSYRETVSEKLKEYRKNNIERAKVYGVKYNKDNKEIISRKNKARYIKNFEYTSKQKKKFYRENFERISEKRKLKLKINKENSDWVEKRRLANRRLHNIRKLKDVKYVVEKSLRTSLRTNINRYLKGKKTESIKSLIGCTTEEFIKYIENQFVEGMMWAPKNFHLDHIKPCSSFDLTDPEQVKQCFHFTNYQPLWPEENLEKRAKLDWERKDKM